MPEPAGNTTPDMDVAQVLDLVTAAWRSRALYAAVTLEVPDLIAEGAVTDADIAARTGADPDRIHRLMRLLVALDVFAGGPEGYRLTPASQLLRRDAPGSLRGLCVLYGEEFHRAWDCLVPAIRDGRSGFESAFGRSLHEHLTDQPGAGRKFLDAMNAANESFAAVPHAFDFTAARTVVDVAGGSGLLLSLILRAHPHLHGVLFDRAAMASVAEQQLADCLTADRYTVCSGDMFAALPADADVYVLARVLQDWDDDRGVRLLRRCREAMTPTARLMVVERLVGGPDTDLLPLLWDLHLMVAAGGRERTLPEYRRLLNTAGLRIVRTVPLPLQSSLIVAAPA
ncbi:methyltransferase [Micromonospora sp. NPDC023814]|uniref:methyltransferase n=1 Tax=Micromonospora sp. NPDC023814 TaxID=3154596 RepID=UPI00340C3DB4